ncbi:HAL/PAL/TAL family ammonia-lyase [Flavobacterium psychrophilum]|uniref:HAL/PAL/TAL family ammonia-lyase n=1 Tax=Flavobacterium psychrophilum TaxID=96345 RepID=UPI000B7C2D88|nr:aromatic amino acid ammonia-lyase [Flavobacterium psychrophilum]MBF2024294.1 aromatic amino acid lyase [Flavobacterium psychrophilum]MCB5982865.1 aromatic amino acid ammonia-lyase [Flavobacterium psychrophilum]MCB5995165.1 aromatic amino acid ammonia-lyase [Flavobacterium psychrophilum]MCB5997620.1 aromatic amino acid ammonia-lyase [Flavobacterium psychrophilum]MCB6005176.1 aromatic amino acid ammonia-lyase [Flavobacterium psychrophilum]
MNIINEFLSLKEFESIVFNDSKIEISEIVLDRVNKSFDFLKAFSENKVIYGVNTGFGPMAQYRIKDQDRLQLQYNLIRSHCSGTGKPLNPLCVKAAILARLNTLSLGNSGVHPSLIYLMKELINKDITPLIFEHGGVGASGDLVQLAHLALVLIGEGEVFYKGERRLTQEVFELENLKPIQVEIREGLALMNGTSVMTGIGVVNVHNANKLLDWSLKFSCAINEIVQAYDDHFSAELNNTKRHKGQREVAEKMRTHLADSTLIRKREDHLYTGENTEDVFKEKVQEYYSLRCVPQILGPVLETINNAASILEDEFNSANDNPIIDVKNQHVYHGGNFHGDYISLEMDKLKVVITKLTMLAERQLNYLLNSKINEILPPFVNLGTLGFNFGMQGVQFTATSTTAENQMLSNPMYIHSIPNNNDNQDIVSMGTNAAVITAKVIENAFEVLAIELITIVQAIDCLDQKEAVSSVTRKMYDEVRKIIPTFTQDQVMYPFVQNVKDYLINN